MAKENIEIQIIHTPAMEEDTNFGLRVLINEEDTSVLELTQEQILHIGAILLKASRKCLDIANLNNNEKTRKN